MNVYAPARAWPLRQQPRFKLPARLVVGDNAVPTLDWSRDGVSITAGSGAVSPGDTFSAALCFDLPGGVLSTPVEAIVRTHDRASGRTDISIAPSPGADLAAIDFVIESYLAGRITAMDGTLSKSETLRAAPRVVVPEADVGQSLRRIAGLVLISLAGAAALYFLASSAYGRLFVIDAVSAQIAFPTVEVDAPSAGTVTGLASAGPVSSGARLFTVTDAAGTETVVTSPCTCELVGIQKPEGSFVSPGSSVVKLARSDAAPTVLVSVAFPDMRRIYDGAAVDLKFLDGQVVRDAHVVEILSLSGVQSGVVSIAVEPGRPLRPAQYGEPVYASFDTAPWRHSH
jgi:hypothetical protein